VQAADGERTPQKPLDAEAGIALTEAFLRFDQQHDIYNRSVWDPAIRSEKATAFFESHTTPLVRPRKAEGFTAKDFALRNAAWHLADYLSELNEESCDRREGFLDSYTALRPGATTKTPVHSPEPMSAEIKHTARFFGADLVGICAYDDRWVYARKYSRRQRKSRPMDLPEGLTSVIMVATEMDADAIKTGPSVLSSAASGLGYSQDILVILSLAQYIRNLGYQAVASLNDTALNIPLAIQAGLGEYGRNGLLITREFGPRVRLGKVFTDLPLAADRPVSFGVQEFCAICRECVTACPIRAIPSAGPTAAGSGLSTIRGVVKWSIDPEKCFRFWTNQNTDCSICIRACPYNKDYRKWYFRLGRRLAGTGLRYAMLTLHQLLRFGRRERPTWWWRKSASHQTYRELR